MINEDLLKRLLVTSHGAPEWGLQPSGTLDVERLLCQQPPWLQAGTAVQKEAGILILSDDLLRYSSVGIKQAFAAILKQLCDDYEFRILAWTGSELISMTTSSFDTIECFEKIKSGHPDIIIKAASEIHINRDSIVIINEFERANMLENKVQPKNQLSVSEARKAIRLRSRNMIQKLQERNLEVDCLVDDELSGGSQETLVELKELYPDASEVQQYTSLKLDSEELAQLFEGKSDEEQRELSENLKTIEANVTNFGILNRLLNLAKKTMCLSIDASRINTREGSTNDLSLYSGSLENLNTLGLKLPKLGINNSEMMELLLAAPNLKRFELYAGVFRECPPLPDGSLSRLGTICWGDVSCNIRYLEKFLQKTSVLKELRLSACDFTLDDFSLKLNLEKLQNIEIEDCAFTSKNLSRLLIAAAPGLESLSISDCKGFNEPLVIEKGILNKLREIQLFFKEENGDISRIIESILCASPQLEKLEIKTINYKKTTIDVLQLGQKSLEKLKVLSTEHFSFKGESFSSILHAAPYLETISISDSGGENPINLPGEKLENLQNIYFNRVTLGDGVIESLSVIAPKLETMSIVHGTNPLNTPGKTLALHKGSFPELKKLYLTHLHSMSGQKLKNLLNATLKLTEISICNCEKFLDPLTLDKESLPYLRKIQLRENKNFSTINFGSILSAASELEELLLHDTNFSEFDHLQRIIPTKLRVISVQNCNISSATLSGVLRESPDLNKLSLSLCSEFQDDLDIHPMALKKISKINLDRCSLTEKSLHLLLQAAVDIDKLVMSNSTGMVRSLQLDNASLNKLKDIELHHGNINKIESGIVLNGLLIAAPNLINLSITRGWLTDRQIFRRESLARLQNIFLSNCVITTEVLSAIFRASPILRKISFSNCHGLEKAPNVDGNCLSELEQIELIDNSIPKEILEKLILAAPKLNTLIIRFGLIYFGSITKSITITDRSTATLKSIVERIIKEITEFHKSSYRENNLQERPNYSPPKHDPQKYKYFQPEKKQFVFDPNSNPRKDQRMLINKLCQYQTVMNKSCELIPELQDGICYHLSSYYTTHGFKKLDSLLDKAVEWNGEKHTLQPSLAQGFDELISIIKNDKTKKYFYLGDNTRSYLASLDKGQRVILGNPWHAISVEKLEINKYRLYDSNCDGVNRPLKVDELEYALKEQIGILINVLDPNLERNIKVITELHNLSDIDKFISVGGLFSICLCINFNTKFFTWIGNRISHLDKNTIAGILLRDISGEPAWTIAERHSNPNVKKLAHKLLDQFQKLYGKESPKYLSTSMAAITRKQQRSQLDQHLTLANNRQEYQGSAAHEYRVHSSISKYIKRKKIEKCIREKLSPWGKKRCSTSSFIQDLLRPADNDTSNPDNRLIRFKSGENLLTFVKLLVSQATKTNADVFVVNNPKDLICSAPFIRRDGASVSLIKGPGGPLHQFLDKCAQQNSKAFIVINFGNFTPSDILMHNSILDSTGPTADGTPIPPGTRIIGIANDDHYKGPDFISRLTKIYDYPSSGQILDDKLMNSSSIALHGYDPTKSFRIDLFNDTNWKAILLGSIRLKEDSLQYEDGQLSMFIKSGYPHLVIKNGPWHDSEFSDFWRRLTIGAGVYHAGDWHRLPDGLTIIRAEGYAWDSLKKNVVSINQGLNKTVKNILNSYTLSKFLGGYLYDEGKQAFEYNNGYIASMRPGLQEDLSELSLNVTCNLSEDMWARLLSHCQKYNVQLKLYLASDIKLPEIFNTQISMESCGDDFSPLTLFPTSDRDLNARLERYHACNSRKLSVIISSDIDVTKATLEKNIVEALIISVSGLEPQDLFYSSETHYDRETLKISISRKTGFFLDMLGSRRHVVLHGNFSPKMVDALANFVLSQELISNLTLISDKPDSLSCFLGCDWIITKYHHVTSEEKKKLLSPDIKFTNKLIKTENLSRLLARQNTHEPWAGMSSLEGKIDDRDPFDFKDTQNKAQAFHQQRLTMVDSILRQSPYAYLTGLTGVGKTTFVEKNFTPQNNYNLFYEASRIIDWARAEPTTNPILFFDEENTNNDDRSIFEGLFHNNPYIIINGTYYPLGPEHKVIFSGNPKSYGDRENKLFFIRHGGAVLFSPLSKAVIYEDVLKPMFHERNFPDNEIQESCATILDIYSMICENSVDEVLITPRELQMVALLALSNRRKNKRRLNIEIQHAILSVCIPALEGNESLIKLLKQKISPVEALTHGNDNIGSQFHVTGSLSPIVKQLQSYLTLRHHRMSDQGLNETQHHGGLGGIVLEGEPGCGKSELIVRTLKAAGIQERRYYETSENENCFYKVPASMGYDQKIELLKKAFNEGSVVIMDEINSSPRMEHTLNAMLMGLHPDTHKRPEKPGFMVLGTQNPISMAGRRVTSPALRRRLTTLIMPDHTKQELCDIVQQKTGLNSDDTGVIVDIYLERREYAKSNSLEPGPCLRDLISLVQTSGPEIAKLSQMELPPVEIMKAFYIEKSWFSSRASWFKWYNKSIFNDASPETVWKTLQERAKTNPDGASSKTIKFFTP